MTQPTNTAMVGTAAKQATLKDLLTRAAPALAQVAPKHLTADRLVKIALSATSRNPDLLACSPASVLRAVMQGAEMGLEVGGMLGEAYLVPFKNKHTKAIEATFIPGYRGLLKLARNSGLLKTVEAHVVYEQDVFELEFGLTPRLVHKPCMKGERGAVVCAYAIAHFKDGGHQMDVMTVAELDAIKKRSQASDSGPWVTDEPEMQKKTVVRRLSKYLPLSPELAAAVAHDEAVDSGELQTIDVSLIEDSAPAPAELTEPKSNVSSLKNKVAAQTKVDADGVVADPDSDGR